MARPNFFVVGAPRCGTSAMWRYLAAHPEIFMSPSKEPQFFGTDFRAPWFIDDLNDYLQLFDGVGGEKCVGEASILYLYSQTAAREIYEFCPEAKILIMLRNPVEMIHSWHAQLLYNRHEDIAEFDRAVAAETDRRAGRGLPANSAYPPIVFLYREMGKYAAPVRRFVAVFPKDQVHVIVYDEFKSDTAGVYRSCLDFLNVDTTYTPEFRVDNQNKKARVQWLENLIANPPDPVRKVAKMVLPDKLRRRGIRKISRANRYYQARESMPEGFREQLMREFEPDVNDLEVLLGRDLGSWKVRRDE